MSFSQEWEDRYQQNTHLSIWPWSDVVSFVMRHFRSKETSFRVLELGCGAGANIPFFLSLGAEYFAIEGSETIVNTLHKRFPELTQNIVVDDFTQTLPMEGPFDLILDRAALTCNNTAAIERGLCLVYERLKPGGKFIGIDWYSTAYSDYRKGSQGEDSYTRTGYKEGSFAGAGRVHFSDKTHLIDLFKRFEILVLEHKVVRRELPDDGWNFASWNLVAQKRG